MNRRLKLPSRQSLIWKIMLIFWITTALTIIANIVITREIVRNEHQRLQLEETLQRLSRAAVSSYQEGGKAGLAQWYRQTYRNEGYRVVLLDEQRRPLAKRRHGDRNHERHPPGFKFPLLQDEIGIAAADGRFFTLKLLPSPAMFDDWRSPKYLHGIRLATTFLIIFLGSAWLARSLARPINSMRIASERFGQGQLETRLPEALTRRKDELGQLSTSFNAMAARIERLLQSQQQLFRDVSHEIRTPLTRQKLAIELARSADDPAPMLDKLEQQNQSIENLIDQILNLLRLDTHASDFRPEEVALKALVLEVIEEAQLDLKHKNIRTEVTLADDVEVRVDRELLKCALQNIVLNAIKYSPEASRLDISGSDSDEGFTLAVEDQGPGIPEADLGRVLNAFYRTDSSRNQDTGGYGLGLAIVKRIMLQMGGQLRLKNRDDRHSDNLKNSKNGLRVELIFEASEPV